MVAAEVVVGCGGGGVVEDWKHFLQFQERGLQNVFINGHNGYLFTEKRKRNTFSIFSFIFGIAFFFN